jgi:Icc-related predicted phosphoesterase
VIRRLNLPWPALADRPVRLLAVSDEAERALDFEANRTALGKIDGILGCGDLEPAYLCFLADAFSAPLLYVRGNHDRGANWSAGRKDLPQALGHGIEELAGLPVAGLSWPGGTRSQAVRDEGAAWRQAFSTWFRLRGARPLIILSHVPPRGLGDVPEDAYHRGFAAYRWLCRRLRPRLWLHGHTAPAAAHDWRVQWADTTLVNVTGAVLVEIGTADRATVNIGA